MKTRRLVVQLLGSIGSTREIRQYLQRFSGLDTHSFAVVKVGGAILRDQLDELAGSLSFLHQLGLFPVVVHGAGPQLDEALDAAGIDREYHEGMRCTSAQAMPHIRAVILRQNLALVSALERNGARARSILTGTFEAEAIDEATYGYVGRVARVHTEAIDASIEAGCIPVLGCLGETAGGQTLNVNADLAANELVATLQPNKIVFLTGTGGLLDEYGEILSSINLRTDYDALMKAEWVHSGMRLKLQQINALLERLPPDSSVSITRPQALARELFTHGGDGTLVRRGEQVHAYDAWDALDRERATALIESAFQRRLVPEYQDRVPLRAAYISDNYRAGAIISEWQGIARLDKFAVAEQARGEGLGRVIWERLRTHHPSMFWRSRPDNPVNDFYFAESDGCMKGDTWNVFWYGLDDFDLIRGCVAYARAQPPSLTDHLP
ncbi:MAG: acetylglutamate kinase [Pseudomonadota bacterium]